MAQTGYTPIYLYYSGTATHIPLAANLGNGELAINAADGNLFYKNTSNAVVTIPVLQSSSTQSGWLSSTDWNTFNNKAPAGAYLTSVTADSPLTGAGTSASHLSMPAATGSVNGYLTSTDWTTFNNKQPAGSYLTTVTADSPLTGSGTSGSHLSMPAASGSVNGYLTSTDWTTFNSKQPAGTYVTSVSGTAPVVSSGGTTPAISMAAATGSVNGYLTSTDWTTFNSKQAALVSGTNIKTVSGTTLLGSGDLGTIGTGYGGTGLTSFTAQGVMYASSSSVLATGTGITYDGSLGVGYGANPSGIGSALVIGNYSSTSATLQSAYFATNKAILVMGADGATNANGVYITSTWANGGQGPIRFNVSATEAMRVHGSAGVSIGNTTDPGATNLYVTGNGNFGATGASRLYARGSGATSGSYAVVIDNSTPTQMFALRNDGAVFTGTSTSGLGACPYNNTTANAANMVVGTGGDLQRSTSALKYKQDIRDLELIDIFKFRPVRYKSKCENDDQTKDFFGLIADEVDEAGIKELVNYNENGDVESFQYERLTVVLLKKLQDLSTKFDSYVESHP